MLSQKLVFMYKTKTTVNGQRSRTTVGYFEEILEIRNLENEDHYIKICAAMIQQMYHMKFKVFIDSLYLQKNIIDKKKVHNR